MSEEARPNHTPTLVANGDNQPFRSGLENRFGLLGPTRVQIPPPPLTEPNPAPDAGFRRGQAPSPVASGLRGRPG